MKKTVFVLLICASGIVNGYSQTKVDLIRELFKVMHQDSVINQTFLSIIPSMLRLPQSHIKDSIEVVRAQEKMKATMPIIRDIIKRMLDEDMVAIYDKNFTESEIRDFIAFYKSPSGQKYISKTPEIQKELMPVFAQKYLPEIQKAMKAKMEEMKTKGQQ